MTRTKKDGETFNELKIIYHKRRLRKSDKQISEKLQEATTRSANAANSQRRGPKIERLKGSHMKQKPSKLNIVPAVLRYVCLNINKLCKLLFSHAQSLN